MSADGHPLPRRPRVVLVVFGGLLAACDCGHGRAVARRAAGWPRTVAGSARSLLAIAADTGAHINAVNFLRVLAETSAAVLVTLAFAGDSSRTRGWSLLIAAVIMTAVSFVLVGASPRSVGRAHPRGRAAVAAPVIRAVPAPARAARDVLVWLGNRVTPGRPAAPPRSRREEQLLSMVDEATELDVLEQDDRELIHSIFELSDTVVREVMVPRTDMVTIDADATARTRRCGSSSAAASPGCRCVARTPTRSSACCTCATSRALELRAATGRRRAQPAEPSSRGRRCSCPTRRRPTTRCGRCSSSRTTSRWSSTSTAASPGS